MSDSHLEKDPCGHSSPPPAPFRPSAIPSAVPKTPEKKEVLFHGIPASPGICRGRVLVIGAAHTDFTELEPVTVDAASVEQQVVRFQRAIDETRAEIKELQKKMQKTIEAREASIFDAHLLIVEDKMLHKEVTDRIRSQHLNAESSFLMTIRRYIAAIASTGDSYLQERAGDLRDIANRVLQNLDGIQHGQSLDKLPENTVIIAHDLTPSDTAMLDRKNILGFAIETGSRTCHTSILARSLRIPAVVGMRNIAGKFANGDEVIVDGFLGMVIRNPHRETLDFYAEKISRKDELYSILLKESSYAAETTDGYRVKLCANIEGANDLEEVFRYGAEGVGLFRTEYLFMNTAKSPDEESQYQTYCKLLKAMRGRSVTIRTIDLGGDKLDAGGAASTTREPNPFLGLRAIRLCHEKPQLIRTQLRALLRAGTEGDLRIMFPMVSSVREIDELLAIRDEIASDLTRENIPFDPKVKIGAMIEIPSAALIADSLAAKLDFFSIGSNDLVQYTLAVDRLNERVAYLFRPSHPAVMELIRLTVQAANKHRIPVCVCGEIAADPRFTPILLGLGVHELSMSPTAIAAIRSVIRKISMFDSEHLAKVALTASDPEDVMTLSKEHIQSVAPDIASILV